MGALSERFLSSYRQGGPVHVVRRASLYAQRVALAKAAPLLALAGRRRSDLVRYLADIDRRQEAVDTDHVGCLIDLSDRQPVIAALPDYITPFVRAVSPFAKKGLRTVSLDRAHVTDERVSAVMLPFSLVHVVEPIFLRAMLSTWHVACANQLGATFCKAAAASAVDGASAVARIGDELARLESVQNDGYLTRGGYRLKCRRNGFELSMIDEVWDAYFGWGLTFDEAATIIDIGANIGAFTVEASRRAPHGRVIAFEPEPENFSLLRQNVETRGARNVTLRQEAVSDRAGTARLALDTEHTGAHTIIGTKDGVLGVDVPLVPFSDVLTDIGAPVDVLKVDCEGAEYDVLLSAPDLIRRRVRQIVAEAQWTDRHLPKDLTNYLGALGFNVDYRGSKNLGLIKATNPALTS